MFFSILIDFYTLHKYIVSYMCNMHKGAFFFRAARHALARTSQENGQEDSFIFFVGG